MKDKIYKFICENGKTSFKDIVDYLGIVRDTHKRVQKYKQIDACLFKLIDAGLICRTIDYSYDKVQ